MPNFNQLEQYTQAHALGGGTSSTFKITQENGERPLVVKYGANPNALKIEILCNAIYRYLGISVPESQAFDKMPTHLAEKINYDPQQNFQLAEYIEPHEIHDEAAIIAYARKYYVVHALLGNTDITKFDNFIQNKSGEIFLIDAGNNFIFKALGEVRTENNREIVTEVDTLKTYDSDKLQWFGTITDSEIRTQVKTLLEQEQNLDKFIWDLSEELEIPDHYRIDFLHLLSLRFENLALRFYPEVARHAKVNRLAKAESTAAGILTYAKHDNDIVVLLSQRINHNSNTDPSALYGLWDCFGGGSDNTDVNLRYTAAREVNEESSQQFSYSPAALLNAPFHDLITQKNNQPFIYRLYISKHVYVDPQEFHDNEHTDHQWVSLAQLKEALSQQTMIDANEKETVTIKLNDKILVLYPEFYHLLKQKPVLENINRLLNKKPLQITHSQSVMHAPVDTQSPISRNFKDPSEIRSQTVKAVTDKLTTIVEIKNTVNIKESVSQERGIALYHSLDFETQTEMHLRAIIGNKQYQKNTIRENVAIMLDSIYPQINKNLTENQKTNLTTHCLRLIDVERQGGPLRAYTYHGCDNKVAFAYDVYSAVNKILHADSRWHAFRFTNEHFQKFPTIAEFIEHYSKSGQKQIDNNDEDYTKTGISANWSLFGNHTSASSCSIVYFVSNTTTLGFSLETILRNLLPLEMPQMIYDKLLALFNTQYPEPYGVLYQLGMDIEDVDLVTYAAASQGPLNPYHGTFKLSEIKQLIKNDLDSHDAQKVETATTYLSSLQVRMMVAPHQKFEVNTITVDDINGRPRAPNFAQFPQHPLIQDLIYELLLHLPPDRLHEKKTHAAWLLKNQLQNDGLPYTKIISNFEIEKAFVRNDFQLVKQYVTEFPKHADYAMALAIKAKNDSLCTWLINYDPTLKNRTILSADSYNYHSVMQIKPQLIFELIAAIQNADKLMEACFGLDWPKQLPAGFIHNLNSLRMALCALDADEDHYQYAMTHLGLMQNLPELDAIKHALQAIVNILPTQAQYQLLLNCSEKSLPIVLEMAKIILRQCVKTHQIDPITQSIDNNPAFIQSELINICIDENSDAVLNHLIEHYPAMPILELLLLATATKTDLLKICYPEHQASITDKTLKNCAQLMRSIIHFQQITERLTTAQCEKFYRYAHTNILDILSQLTQNGAASDAVRQFISGSSAEKCSILFIVFKQNLNAIIATRHEMQQLLDSVGSDIGIVIYNAWNKDFPDLFIDLLVPLILGGNSKKYLLTTLYGNNWNDQITLEHIESLRDKTSIVYQFHNVMSLLTLKQAKTYCDSLLHSIDDILIRSYDGLSKAEMIMLFLSQLTKEQRTLAGIVFQENIRKISLDDEITQQTQGKIDRIEKYFDIRLDDIQDAIKTPAFEYLLLKGSDALVLLEIIYGENWQKLITQQHLDFCSSKIKTIEDFLRVTALLTPEQFQLWCQTSRSLCVSQIINFFNGLPIERLNIACFVFENTLREKITSPSNLLDFLQKIVSGKSSVMRCQLRMIFPDLFAQLLLNINNLDDFNRTLLLVPELSHEMCTAHESHIIEILANNKDEYGISFSAVECIEKLLSPHFPEQCAIIWSIFQNQFKNLLSPDDYSVILQNLSHEQAEAIYAVTDEPLDTFLAIRNRITYMHIKKAFRENKFDLVLEHVSKFPYLAKYVIAACVNSRNITLLAAILKIYPELKSEKFKCHFYYDSPKIDESLEPENTSLLNLALFYENINDENAGELVITCLGHEWPNNLPNDFRHSNLSLLLALKTLDKHLRYAYVCQYLPNIYESLANNAPIFLTLLSDDLENLICAYHKLPNSQLKNLAFVALEAAINNNQFVLIDTAIRQEPGLVDCIIAISIKNNHSAMLNHLKTTQSPRIFSTLFIAKEDTLNLLINCYGPHWQDNIPKETWNECAQKIQTIDDLHRVMDKIQSSDIKRLCIACEPAIIMLLNAINNSSYNDGTTIQERMLSLLASRTEEQVQIMCEVFHDTLGQDFIDAAQIKNGPTHKQLKQAFDSQNLDQVELYCKQSPQLAIYAFLLCIEDVFSSLDDKRLPLIAKILGSPGFENKKIPRLSVFHKQQIQRHSYDSTYSPLDLFLSANKNPEIVRACFGDRWPYELPDDFTYYSHTFAMALQTLPQNDRYAYVFLHLETMKASINPNNILDALPTIALTQLITDCAQKIDNSNFMSLVKTALKRMFADPDIDCEWIKQLLETHPPLIAMITELSIQTHHKEMLIYIDNHVQSACVAKMMIVSEHASIDLLTACFGENWLDRITRNWIAQWAIVANHDTTDALLTHLSQVVLAQNVIPEKQQTAQQLIYIFLYMLPISMLSYIILNHQALLIKIFTTEQVKALIHQIGAKPKMKDNSNFTLIKDYVLKIAADFSGSIQFSCAQNTLLTRAKYQSSQSYKAPGQKEFSTTKAVKHGCD